MREMGHKAVNHLLMGRRHHRRMARTQRKAIARGGEDAPVPAKHLTASMQVLRAHQRRRHVTVADAREAVKEAALMTATGMPGPETQALVAKLEKVTGCSIADLAVHAEDWPE